MTTLSIEKALKNEDDELTIKKHNGLFLIKYKKISMMKFTEKYYPVILAFISFLLSVSLWFNGQKDEGMFVGIWVPSILSLAIFIRLVKND